MDDHLKLLILLSLSASFLSHVSAEIPRREVESASTALRARGYNLFANAVTVSDLLFQVLAGDQFTFFAPPDFSLFSLDMSSDAFRYVHSLRLHVVPLRLTLSDLRNLSLSPISSVPTLAPRHHLFFANRRTDIGVFDHLVVNGVRLSSPNIYLGRHIAVHGLDATLSDDLPPSDNFQDELGLHLESPPPAPTPDLLSPAVPPVIEVSPPDFQGMPMSPVPDFPPAVPPSPEMDTFAHSPDSPNLSPSATIGMPPESPHLAPEALKPVSPSPANTASQKSPHLAPEAIDPVSSPPTNTISPESPHLAPEVFKPVTSPPETSLSHEIPEVPSPWNDQGDHAGPAKSESEYQSDLSPMAESPASVILPPRLSPFSSPRIRSMPPISQSEAAESNDQNHPSEQSKEALKHTKHHRKSKKKHMCGKHHRKHKCKKNHHHREGKKSHHHSPNWWSLEL